MRKGYRTTHLHFPAGGGGRMLLSLISSMYYKHLLYKIGMAGEAHDMHHSTNLDFRKTDNTIPKKLEDDFYWWHHIDWAVDHELIKNCNYVRMVVTDKDTEQIAYLRIIKNFIGDSLTYYHKQQEPISSKLVEKTVFLSSDPTDILHCYDVNEIYKSFIKIGRKVSKYLLGHSPKIRSMSRQDVWDLSHSYKEPLPLNIWRLEKYWHQYRAWRFILAHSKNIPLGIKEMIKDHLVHTNEDLKSTKDGMLKYFSETTFDPVLHSTNNTLPIHFRNIMTKPHHTIKTLENFYNKKLPSASKNFYLHYLKYNEEFAKLFFPSLNWRTGDFKWT